MALSPSRKAHSEGKMTTKREQVLNVLNDRPGQVILNKSLADSLASTNEAEREHIELDVQILRDGFAHTKLGHSAALEIVAKLGMWLDEQAGARS